jgi:hypothetical protein
MILTSPVMRHTASALLLLGSFTGWGPELRAQNTETPEDLKIVIIEGDNFTNNLKKRVAREPIVEVQSRQGRPLAGATVLFTLPGSGPGAAFANGSRTLSVVTNSAGRAAATGLRANSVAGTFKIGVSASFQGQTASAVITQTNAIAGAAAGGGAAGASGAGGGGGGIGGIGVGATVGVVGAAATAVAVTAAKLATDDTQKGRITVGDPQLP